MEQALKKVNQTEHILEPENTFYRQRTHPIGREHIQEQALATANEEACRR